MAGMSRQIGVGQGTSSFGLWDSIGLVIRPFDKSFYPKDHVLVKTFFHEIFFMLVISILAFFRKRYLNGMGCFCFFRRVGR